MNNNMQKIRCNVAGIDIGSDQIFIGFADGSVEQFGTFTCDFASAIARMQQAGIESVAIEATGVYGVILHEMIEEAGIEVYLVNPVHIKKVPGRKTDVLDCQWIQQLHSYGLLTSSFIVDEQVRPLRSYLRLRHRYIEEAARAVNRMQKVLTLMNIRLTEVLSQVHGASGMRMIKAILDGWRDPKQLLELCDKRIQNNKAERVIAALEGHYRQEYLFELQHSVDEYEFYQHKIGECDRLIDTELEKLAEAQPVPESFGASKPIRHNSPKVANLHEKVVRANGGVNLCELPGLTDYSALRLISELGIDLSAFPSEKHFVSWLKLAPGKKNSGKKNKNHKFNSSPNATLIFKQAAQSLIESKSHALGAFGRRIKARRGPGIAVKAVARKLAELYYRAMTYGLEYVEQGVEEYERQFKQRKIKNLERQAKQLGYQLLAS